jgi:hypothetical protein
MIMSTVGVNYPRLGNSLLALGKPLVPSGVCASDRVKGRRGEVPPPRPWLRPAAEAPVVVRASAEAHTRTGSQSPT